MSAGWDLVNIITRLQDYFEQYAELIEKMINLDLNDVLDALRRPFIQDPFGSIQELIYS